jgi:hypothetical protein
MMRAFLLTLGLVVSIPAHAQQPPSDINQRIATQIGNLIIQVTSQSVQIEQLQAALAAAQQQVKDLQAKQESPK